MFFTNGYVNTMESLLDPAKLRPNDYDESDDETFKIY